MAPRYSTEGLSSASKCKKAAMCLTEKGHVLDKLASGMSYSVVVGCEFHVNEPTIYIK